MIAMFRLPIPAVLALVLAGLAPAHAQDAGPPPSATDGVTDRVDSFKRDTGNFFGNIFGGDENPRAAPPRGDAPVATAQLSASDLVVRLDRLENTIRQLTGSVEQLQYRNQQLEQQLKKMQEDVDYRFQEQGKGGRPPVRPQAGPPPVPPPQVQAAPPAPAPPPVAPTSPRRADSFDPNQNPTAPGAPHTLGAIPGAPDDGPPPVVSADGSEEPRVGAPGGRQAGAPLDLSTLSSQVSQDPSLAPPGPGPQANAGPLPPPPPRNPSATGGQQQATLPPTQSPKDEYDLAYGYLLRKDYALSEESFRAFLKKYPSDRLTGEANYWLGESLFQRQRYRDAAESFLTVSTKFDRSGKAPDALLRLGQSLAALNEKEAACATLAEITRKYPRASAGVKQGIEREQKRVHC